jgi:hypothetical protein
MTNLFGETESRIFMMAAFSTFACSLFFSVLVLTGLTVSVLLCLVFLSPPLQEVKIIKAGKPITAAVTVSIFFIAEYLNKREISKTNYSLQTSLQYVFVIFSLIGNLK